MPLTSEIADYDPAWPTRYDAEATRLRPLFGNRLASIHHVGSTAVEGLAAKPEIDILAIVVDTECLSRWTSDLQTLGYRRGGDLREGHHFFKRDAGSVRTHKLHVCAVGHPQATRMLTVRDHLRTHANDRMTYEALKRRLERQNENGIAEYLSGKAPFLDDLYEHASINRESG